MRLRFIEKSNYNNILMKTINTEILSAVFVPHTQIYITKENEILVCEYNYNVLKVLENEIDIFVTIADTTKLSHEKTV
ncbi:hypothetical protein [Clostridium sp. JS66]|uniref:hypothetical protein n=1 Tax=Clostridium sp. JS66 TaxID=3064705 RepID=UPI00298D9770|nr:hypothetical protein [Clostridium sp. JS66]WPC42917.1 hypothetical protein Q6H37_05450 [Clostridium sp. JS66]